MSGNCECFRRAVRVLIGPGAVKPRLIQAYLEHLRYVDEADLPESVVLEFHALRSAFTGVKPAGGQCATEAAVRKMSEQDAGLHAARILDLFLVLSGAHGEPSEAPATRRLRVVGDDEDLPAFLSRA